MNALRRYWRDPGFWSWVWRERVNPGAKALLALLFVTTLGVLGYWSAQKMSESQEVVFTEKVVTVTRTTLVNGKPQLVTQVRTVREDVEPKVVTVRRNGGTVTLTTAGETVLSMRTIRGPGSVRVKQRTIRTPGKERVVTLPGVTLPGTTIGGPERAVTITGPSSTVTTPGRTTGREVTVTGPTQTVTGPTQTVKGPTQTVTGPTQTVTGQTVTVTVTNEVTVTETVTETSGP